MNQEQSFKRDLGLFDSTMIVIGSMIGSGIFIVSADISRTVGGGGWVLLVWALTGIFTLIAALSYGELAGMMPKAGGQYVYLREAYNPFIAFLYGWTLFSVIQTGTIAAVAVAFAKYTGIFIPFVSEKNIVLSLGSFQISGAQLLAILSIWILTAINLRGVREGKIIQNIFTFSKTAALVILIALGLFFAGNASTWTNNLSTFWDAQQILPDGTTIDLAGAMLIAMFGTAMVGSIFSSDAWNNITFTAGEVREPSRNIPLSLAIGTGIVTLLYILANIAYMHVLPVIGFPQGTDVMARGMQFAVSDRVGAAAAEIIFGASGAAIMAALIMVSTFGCNNGIILSGARAYFAMAKDGLFFSKAGDLNANGVPGKALIIQAMWASLLCLSGTYGALLDYVVTAVLIFYILTILGIFRLRSMKPDADRPYKAFGYPILPAIYIAFASAIILDLLVFKPGTTIPGVLLVLTGIPLYAFMKKTK
ncbi:MAG: amino acid permease [Bacteroidetes bacterium]|nr:amino acid permease [bacterium]NBP64424.1 amino acid permease [Bacteroidota bacterium]